MHRCSVTATNFFFANDLRDHEPDCGSGGMGEGGGGGGGGGGTKP